MEIRTPVLEEIALSDMAEYRSPKNPLKQMEISQKK